MTLLERLEAPGPKRILALDGGGIRGALTLGFLEKLESLLRERHNNPNLLLCEYFDLVGGTSTGAIIASALAIGMSATEIKEMYLDLGDKIFGRKRNVLSMLWKGASFDFKPLEEALAGTFGDIRIGDQERIKTGLCIVAKRADTLSTWPVINHPKGKYYEYNKDILLWQMVRASAAAPTYFVPIEIEVGDGEKAVFIDGGVSMANNPALQLLMVATLRGFPFHWLPGQDKMMLMSIGTGSSRKKYAPNDILGKNLLGWASYLPDLFMEDAKYLNQTILQFLSDSPTAITIDSEIGDLKDDLLTGKPELHYLRYNAWLEQDILQDLGFNFTDEKVHSFRDMSRADNRFDLAKIGEAAAEKAIQPSHLPARFDLGQVNTQIERFTKGRIPDLDFQEAVKKPIPVRCKQMAEDFEVETMEGTLRGKAGDYLMVGVNGEMYPIDKEIFEKTYDVQG
jgi:patatin-like phospholipase/acyl hydrolase